MRLVWIEALQAVADAETLSGAARALSVTRATLRARLSSLEGAVGVALLGRDADGVHLTEEGSAFLREASAMVQAAARLDRFAERRAGAPPRPLRILAPVGTPSALEAFMSRLLQSRLPEVELEVAHHPDPVAARGREADFIAHYADVPPRGPYRTVTILRMPVVLKASRSFLAEHGTPDTLDALHGLPLISWTYSGPDPRHWPLLAGGTEPVRPWMVTRHLDTIRSLVVGGAGIALMPDPPAARLFEPGLAELQAVLPTVVGGEQALRVLIPEAAAGLPAVRALLAVFRDLGAGNAQLDSG